MERFSIKNVSTDFQFKSMCGVKRWFFYFLHARIKDEIRSHKGLATEDRLLLFCMKLKQNDSFCYLSSLFEIHRDTASQIFNSVLTAVFKIAQKWVYWLSREKIKATMPECFRKYYPDTTCVIDASEVRIEAPGHVDRAVKTYSSYKSANTFKFLVVMAPSGLIMFLSKAYGGRTTDAQLTADSGFLNFIQEGDHIMADKGFPKILPDATKKGAFVVMPPFASSNRQFSTEENDAGYNVAAARIHVERVIQQLKIFQILKGCDHSLVGRLNQILLCITYFVNNFDDLIKEKQNN